MTTVIVWINPATSEVSYMKGERTSFYWEPKFDTNVVKFASAEEAKEFANVRVGVPYQIWDLS